LAAVLALTGTAMAAEKEKKAGKAAEKAEGTLTGAAVNGDQVAWTLSTAEGEKTFDMAASVIVMCADRKGQKQARMIRAMGKKEPKAKGKMTFVKGSITKVEVQGNAATITVKTDDAEEALPMGTAVSVAYRERKGKTTATAITAASKGGKGGGKKNKKNAEN